MEILFLLVCFLYVVLFFSWVIIVVLSYVREKNNSKKFLRMLDEQFANGVIENVADVIRLYRGIFQTTYGNIERKLMPLLNKFGASENVAKLKPSSIELYKEICNSIEYNSVFLDLHSNEESALKEINEYCDSNNTEAIRKAIRTFAKNLAEKNKQVSSTIKSNKWSLPLSIIGTILTIVFGLTSFIK